MSSRPYSTNVSIDAFVFETERRDPFASPPQAAPLSELGAQLLRSPPNPRDRTLSPVAQAWYDALPPELQPKALVAAYARVANRIALCWPDAHLVQVLFDDLLNDKRGTRRGFPAEIQVELKALRDRACRQAADREGSLFTLRL
jgi:hypothetical protein